MPNYIKGTRGNIARNNPRKRRYHGNQFYLQECKKFEANTNHNENASGKKLYTRDTEDLKTNPLHGYRIIEFFTVLSEIVKCSVCNQKIHFSESGSGGLGIKMVDTCPCGDRMKNLEPFINNGYENKSKISICHEMLLGKG